MATLTDEDKAKKLLEDVEDTSPVEPEKQDDNPTEIEDEAAAESQDKPVEEATPSEEQSEEPSSFTKPEGYEWVKGETLEEFNKNLITAYENSTAEALRLRQTATTPAPAAEAAAPATAPAPAPLDPGLAYAQSLMQKDMLDAFDAFAKTYPQAREPQSFDQFEKASNGASQAFAAAFGRVPTYPELFEKTAQILGWTPSNARKDAAIKEAAASGDVSTSTGPPLPKSNITNKELEVAKRLVDPHGEKSDSDLLKELAPYKT